MILVGTWRLPGAPGSSPISLIEMRLPHGVHSTSLWTKRKFVEEMLNDCGGEMRVGKRAGGIRQPSSDCHC